MQLCSTNIRVDGGEMWCCGSAAAEIISRSRSVLVSVQKNLKILLQAKSDQIHSGSDDVSLSSTDAKTDNQHDAKQQTHPQAYSRKIATQSPI